MPDGSAAVQSHIVIGAWALIVDCDRPVDVARFLPRVRHIWADPELRPVVLDGADGVIPEPSEPAS